MGDDGVIVVEIDGHTLVLWNHDPARLAELAGANENVVSCQERFGLLRTRSPEGNYLFSVCRADDRSGTPYPTGPPSEDPVALLGQPGGFFLSAAEFRGRLGAGDRDHPPED